jgi:uncharacterized protein with GYD domain
LFFEKDKRAFRKPSRAFADQGLVERRSDMALYAQQIAYTPVAWAALLKAPENRLEALQRVVERLGGQIVDGWFTLGEYDVLVICELPDNVSAVALDMAVAAGGALKAVKTTPLLTFDDGLDAMRKARESAYTPPRSEIPYFGVARGEGAGSQT